jgi:N-dimethylarginine dimethylaminohydrolase
MNKTIYLPDALVKALPKEFNLSEFVRVKLNEKFNIYKILWGIDKTNNRVLAPMTTTEDRVKGLGFEPVAFDPDNPKAWLLTELIQPKYEILDK